MLRKTVAVVVVSEGWAGRRHVKSATRIVALMTAIALWACDSPTEPTPPEREPLPDRSADGGYLGVRTGALGGANHLVDSQSPLRLFTGVADGESVNVEVCIWGVVDQIIQQRDGGVIFHNPPVLFRLQVGTDVLYEGRIYDDTSRRVCRSRRFTAGYHYFASVLHDDLIFSLDADGRAVGGGTLLAGATVGVAFGVAQVDAVSVIFQFDMHPDAGGVVPVNALAGG